MSPNIEPVVIGGSSYELRHVGPRAAVWPSSPAANTTILNQTTMVARPLPMSNVPSSPDFVAGSWTSRLDDAGEVTLTFPNKDASDGVPWRQRFSPAGHNQFIEVYFNGNLEGVFCIDTVQVDQQQVTVHGQDGWFLLKKAYERDWIVVASPRDVIDRATHVWVPAISDNFPAGTLSAQWTPTTAGTGTVTIGPAGGLYLTCLSGGDSATVTSAAISANSTWSASCNATHTIADAVSGKLTLQVVESNGDTYAIALSGGFAQFTLGSTLGQLQVPSATSCALRLESDGEWVWAFVNGQLVGVTRRGHASTTSLTTSMTATTTTIIEGVLAESLAPFLLSGTDKGDYVLPGTAATFPNGGLHGRYYNDTDLISDSNRLVKILNPSRSQAYGASTPAEYQNEQDATITAALSNPQPGAATSNWSAKWFGAIYLKLSAGNYTMQLSTPGSGGSTNFAARVWIGQTTFGTQLVDEWAAFGSQGSNYSFTVSAATLAGTLGYGGGKVARDGWYPIRVEWAVDATAASAPTLYITNSPAGYTDPGGTSIASGSQTTVVPATSLSPLGCVDQRYQGISHYDLAQQTAEAYDHQASVEPQQLESGLFPGVLAPRIREGHDTDIILAPDLSIRQDGEGLLNYSATQDATDFSASLQGNGASFQGTQTGTLQAEVYDPPTLTASLFDVQGWQDFSDASFVSLLDGLLNAQLGLRLTPWQLLSADPEGRPRLAYSWPLPGTIASMFWRPGDGMRIQARDINVFDTSPRQILTLTRNISPDAITSTQASFADRPVNFARTLRQQLQTGIKLGRNYKPHPVLMTGNAQTVILTSGTTDTGASTILLQGADQLVGATVRFSIITGTSPDLQLIVNGTNDTAGANVLNGPWSLAPVNLNLGALATVSSDNRLYVQVKNAGANTVTVVYSLTALVLR